MGRLREPMPLITAVIPVYNAAPYVRTAVESGLRQSCPVHRIIVVDDGSTDDTPALLKSFGGAIEVIRQKNQGVGAARNAGVRAADGDYVAFLDADDVWHVNKLAIFSRVLAERPEAYLLFSDAMKIDFGERLLRRISGKPRGRGTWESLLKTNWVITSTAMVRRSAAQSVGLFRTDFQCRAGVEDWDFFLRLVRAGPSVYVPGAWTFYRQHEAGAIQGQRKKLLEDSLRVLGLNASGVRPSLRKKAEAMVWFESGVRNLVSCDAVSARRDLSKSLGSWPFHLRAALLWIVSLGGEPTVQFLLKCRRWRLRRFARTHKVLPS